MGNPIGIVRRKSVLPAAIAPDSDSVVIHAADWPYKLHRPRGGDRRRVFCMSRAARNPPPTGKTPRSSPRTGNRPMPRLHPSRRLTLRATADPKTPPSASPSTETGSSTGYPGPTSARWTSSSRTSTCPGGRRSRFRAIGSSKATATRCTATSSTPFPRIRPSSPTTTTRSGRTGAPSRSPPDWDGREVFLNFDGVYSAFFVWVNGEYIGYSEGSRTPAEFRITEAVRPGSNVLAVQVYRWSDGSYLEEPGLLARERDRPGCVPGVEAGDVPA